MRHPITIEYRTDDQADFTTDAETWERFLITRAAITKQRGRESVSSQQTEGLTNTIVRTRWQSGVTPGMRIKFSGRYLNITEAVNEDERNRWLVMRCTEAIEEPA